MSIEIRYVTLLGGTSSLDEVVANNASIHLEDMGDGKWWMRISSGKQDVHVWLTTRRGAIITATYNDDGEKDVKVVRK